MVLVILLDDRVLSVMLGLSQEPPRDALTGGFGPAALSYEGGGLWYDAQTRRALELRHEEQGWVLQLSDYRALVDSGMMSQSAFEANLSRLPAGSR